MPIQICPSILNANFEDLPNEIRRVEATSDFLHLDVMDGEFVPRKTFDLSQAEELVKGTTLKTDAHL
ncbi:MAG: ribulose-phosphate 3-epimerase, partial [Actinomycetota bacterium]